MTSLAAPAPIVPTPAPAIEPEPTFTASDLQRLRELIQSTAAQTVNPAGVSPIDPETLAATKLTAPSLGDSILAGILRFGNNYEGSMHAIEARLQDVVRSEGAGLNNFSDILALQIDVSKWSMSVMGVDNASKAGSNTIKELSRGG